MLAIDTNVLLRYLVKDDAQQSPKARALIDGNDVYVCRTVMLECAWVLRSTYGFSTPEICRLLRGFAGLARVTVEAPVLLDNALNRAEAGMDFADALHLGAATDCDAFVTFDRKLVRAAKAVGIETVREV